MSFLHLLLQTAQIYVQTDEEWEADGSGRSSCDSYAAEHRWKIKLVSHVLPYGVKRSESD